MSDTLVANPLDTALYTVTGANDLGCINTTTVTVIVIPIPVIITQPLDQSILAGSNARFTMASSSPSTTFRWQVDSVGGFFNLSNNKGYSGVKNDTLTVTSVSLSQNSFKFRCIIANGKCRDTTTGALLTVKAGGIHNLLTDDFIQIYPNPCTGQVSISGREKIEKIEIADPFGRIVYCSKPNSDSFIVRMESTGIYFLNITSGNKTVRRKLVVQ
jgi:hypothetical protein